MNVYNIRPSELTNPSSLVISPKIKASFIYYLLIVNIIRLVVVV